MNVKSRWTVVVVAAVLLTVGATGGYAQKFAVWLDGETADPTGGGNAILSSLDNTFGSGHYSLVSTPDLEAVGFLSAFDTLIVSRYDSQFGTGLSAAAAANIKAYVGSGASQGGVALFSNDAADNFYGSGSGDPYDNNLNQLFVNAAKFAAASGHGYIGEFNGAVSAMSANTAGWEPLGLLPGTASAVGAYGPQFVYDVGPIGSGNAIDAGVTFPFTDTDYTTFLTQITGADPNNIVDIYTSEGIAGLPAVLANNYVIHGGKVPDAGSTSALMGLALSGLALMARKFRRNA